MSPPASWFMVPVMERIGAPIERDSQKKKPIEAARVTTALRITVSDVVSSALSFSALAAAELG